MLTTQIIPSFSYKQMAWKNGGGLTQEVCRYPKEQDPFHWRISMATINQDGEFSLFNGYQRIITILKGEGIRLQQAQAEKIIHHRDVFSFPGDEAIHCQLVNGPVIDLNLIFDPTLYNRASLQWLQPQITPFTTSANYVLLFSNSGSSKVSINNSIHDLFENDSLLITNPNEAPGISFTMSAPGILIELWGKGLYFKVHSS
jgi:uncharacterized protein